jgi:hypothetical protein
MFRDWGIAKAIGLIKCSAVFRTTSTQTDSFVYTHEHHNKHLVNEDVSSTERNQETQHESLSEKITQRGTNAMKSICHTVRISTHFETQMQYSTIITRIDA